jgi:hypothetical protein
MSHSPPLPNSVVAMMDCGYAVFECHIDCIQILKHTVVTITLAVKPDKGYCSSLASFLRRRCRPRRCVCWKELCEAEQRGRREGMHGSKRCSRGLRTRLRGTRVPSTNPVRAEMTSDRCDCQDDSLATCCELRAIAYTNPVWIRTSLSIVL